MGDWIDEGRRGDGGPGLRRARRLLAGLLSALALVTWAAAGRAAPIASAWLGGAGDWDDPTRWSSNPLFPDNGGGDTFDVSFSSGTSSLTTDITIDSLTQSGATVDGAFDLTLDGLFSWSGGTHSGAATTRANAGIELSSNFSKTVDGRTLVNAGTANHRGGPFTLRDGATLVNSGTWVSDSDSGAGGSGSSLSISSGGSGPNTFDNQGSFVQAGSHSTTVSVAFQNSGSVEVQDGRLYLAGGLTQSGGTTLLSGGELETPGAVNIQGGSLEGTGLVDSDLMLGAALRPGVSAGLLAVDGDLTFSGGAQLSIEIGGLGLGVDYDSLDVTGAVLLDGLLELSFLGGFDASVTGGDLFTILDTDGILTGAFANVASGDRVATFEGHSFRIDYGATSAFDPGSVVLSQFQSVPEPGTAALLALGLGGLAIGGRRHPSRR